MVLGDAVSKMRDVCMDFEPYFKVHNLVNVHPKNIKLGQMTNLDMIFYVMVPDYRLAKIWNSPQFPVEFWNGLLASPTSAQAEILALAPNMKMRAKSVTIKMAPRTRIVKIGALLLSQFGLLLALNFPLFRNNGNSLQDDGTEAIQTCLW